MMDHTRLQCVLPQQLSPEQMWQAVLQRDAALDGVFFYGVKSTGIYCRTVCPSRRPAAPQSVEFFHGADQAEAAGYRACQRCRPASPNQWQFDLQRVLQTCEILEHATPGQGDSLEELARHTGVSPHHLQRTFKRVLGVSPHQYAQAVRTRNFKALLRQGTPVGQAARASHLKSPGTLYAPGATQLNIPPSVYQAGSPGAVIQYATVPCPLGRLLLAATQRGVCSIMLADTDAALHDEIRREFPQAQLDHCPDTLGPFILAVLSSLDATARSAAALDRLPLDIRATAFQQRVWQALTDIPPGDTRTYGEIAASIGAPAAARAVGTACGSNPVALAIPCHRAVPAGGKLSGYRWGPHRKQILLAIEKKQ